MRMQASRHVVHVDDGREVRQDAGSRAVVASLTTPKTRRGTCGGCKIEMSHVMDNGKNAITRWRVTELTYLGLCRGVLIVAVGRSTKGSSRALVTSTNTATLGEILLTLLLSDLDLGLLATTAKFFGLEGALGLELGAPMLGNVAVGHGCEYVRKWLLVSQVMERWCCRGGKSGTGVRC